MIICTTHSKCPIRDKMLIENWAFHPGSPSRQGRDVKGYTHCVPDGTPETSNHYSTNIMCLTAHICDKGAEYGHQQKNINYY
jgi:hypothetical protein